MHLISMPGLLLREAVREAERARHKRRWRWAGPVAAVLIAVGLLFLGWGFVG